jgi:hypothetical protein
MMADGTVEVTYCLRKLLPQGELVASECERVMEIARKAIENLDRYKLPDPLVKDGGCEQQALLIAECGERLLARPPDPPRSIDQELSEDLFVLIQGQFLNQAKGKQRKLELERIGYSSKRRADRANYVARVWFSNFAARRYGLNETDDPKRLCKFNECRAVDEMLASGRTFALQRKVDGEKRVRFYSAQFDEIERPKGVIIKIKIEGDFPKDDVAGVLQQATADEVESSTDALERNGCVIKHCVAAFGETA